MGRRVFTKREWSSSDYLPISSITTVLHHFPTLIFVDKPKVFIKYFPNVLTGSIVQIDMAVSFNKGLTVNGIQDKVLDNL